MGCGGSKEKKFGDGQSTKNLGAKNKMQRRSERQPELEVRGKKGNADGSEAPKEQGKDLVPIAEAENEAAGSVVASAQQQNEKPGYQYQRGSESSVERNPVEDSGPPAAQEPAPASQPEEAQNMGEDEIMKYVFSVWQDNELDAEQTLPKNQALDAVEKYLKTNYGLGDEECQQKMDDLVISKVQELSDEAMTPSALVDLIQMATK